jgi:predicted ATPase
MRETGYRLYYSFFHAEWAMVLASSGLPDEGAAEIDAAQRYAEESQSLWCLPEVLRIKGEIFLKRDPADFRVIEGHFQRSQTLAHSQEGLSWELRAALSLARLRVTQGRRGEATQILAPVYDRFTEGFDTADLLAAKQLLDG